MLSALVLIENLRWMIPSAIMLGAAPAYITVWGVWRVVSAALPRWVYVKGDDVLFATYHRNLLFFFEVVTGVELIFYGDLTAIQELSKGENCIYMSNHQSTLDWVLASSVSMRRGCLGSTRYVLKDGLKYFPFYGFYLAMHGSLFVKRAGKFRRDMAERQLGRDAHDKKPMWLVVFPEGTRYNPELTKPIQQSKQFSLEQDLQPLENVLFPRVRAVQVCVEQLRESLDSVYDVTIAYGNKFDFAKQHRLPAPPMQDFLMGASKRVHIHISRIPISQVPTETEELKQWLYTRYLIKDKLLKEFYSAECENDARFPGIRVVKPIPLSSLLPSVMLWSGTVIAVHMFQQSRQVYWTFGVGAATLGLLWMCIRH
ncbi:unnamed protein product [Lymnaea stagnalis]|uniref:Phospholipid/glycerol acyltransferase domain-containing protein n=1 Tax=Lymnaea stagnalis TaxID=6523 RepID=A0AAV2H9U3_LYMST